MTLRVIQWATGLVGKASIACIQNHPDLELVGCWVHSPEKNGKDVGDILGTDRLGITATTDIDEILAIEADAIVYTPMIGHRDELAKLLRSGKNVVASTGWFYPNHEHWVPMQAACLDGNASLHGTGIHPGGATEVFPLMLSAMSSSVTYVGVEELSDIRTYGSPEVVRHLMGFGATRREAENGPVFNLLSHLFTQSMRMVLDTLGLAEKAEVRTIHEIAVATAPIDSSIGIIEPGQVAGQRCHWEAVVGDDVVVRMGATWLMSEENLDPPWSFGGQGPRYEIEIKGNPDTFVTIKGWQPKTLEEGLRNNPGIAATAAHCVNSVPYVCAAPPGIVTSVQLPLVAGRAHPDLLRAES